LFSPSGGTPHSSRVKGEAMLILRNSTAHFAVYYDDQLAVNGIDGPSLADAELARCEADYATLSSWFGVVAPAADLPIHVNVAWAGGSGGGSNNGSNTLTVNCTSTTQGSNVNEIAVAELAELFMAWQNRGWVAGYSHGEGLSRALPPVLYSSIDPNAYLLWENASYWLNNGRPNWVDTTELTDQGQLSYGCALFFLYYLNGQLNFTWPEIIQAAAPTLAQVAGNLGLQNAWSDFIALINGHYPPGTPVFLQADNVFPFAMPSLYMRHNLADDGTSHVGALSLSPDIIVKNAPVSNPQATYSTPASIASDMESDPEVIGGQDNYVYLRVWDRGTDATNVTATVYWSPVSTLVTPSMWNLIGSSTFADVPPGQIVQVSDPGVDWNSVPAPGHYCFVATVGNSTEPAPAPSAFPDFDSFMHYVYAHNNLTWRNFNVVSLVGSPKIHRLPFIIPGAGDRPRQFQLDAMARLSGGSKLALDVPVWLARGLTPQRKDLVELKSDKEKRARIPLPNTKAHTIGKLTIDAKAVAHVELVVEIPSEHQDEVQEVAIRQLYRGREAGRVTFRFLPKGLLQKQQAH
jgi:hypothetical protein